MYVLEAVTSTQETLDQLFVQSQGLAQLHQLQVYTTHYWNGLSVSAVNTKTNK